MTRHVLACAASAALFSIYSSSVFATPYASGVSESAGTVTFRLNQAADNVTIVRDGVPEALGGKASGLVSFPRNSATNYSIQVVKSSGPGYNTISPTNTGSFLGGAVLQWSDDNNQFFKFNSPRGMTVDNNTLSPTYGRIYVANSAAATATSFPARPTLGDGLYAINSDGTDALGQGDSALSGGLAWGGANSPWRIAVGPDGKVYVTDWTDSHGGIVRLEPNLTGGVEVLAGRGDNVNNTVHGSIASKPVFEGTGANFKIYALDEDMTGDPPSSKNAIPTTYQSMFRWDVGTATSYNTAPTKITDFPSAVNNIISVLVDLARAPDGKFFLSQNRNVGTEAGLTVMSNDGQTVVWDSLTATRAALGDSNATDFFKDVQSMQLAPDGSFVTMVTLFSEFFIVPIDSGTGLPDITKAKLVKGGTINNGRDIGADMAGNIYMNTSGHGRLRMFGAGGVTTTTFNSDGTVSRSESFSNPEWTGTGGGTFGDSTKWLSGLMPNSAGWSAKFGSTIAAPSNIDVGGSTTGSIWIDTPHSLTFSGATPLTFAAAVTQQNTGFVATQGNHSVTAPLSIAASFVTTVGSNSFSIGQGTVTAINSMNFNTGAGGTITVGGITVTATATAGTTASAFGFNVGTNGVVTVPVNSLTNNVSFSGTLLTGANVTISDAPRVSNINLNTGTNSTFNITNVTYGTTRFSVTKNGAGTLLIPRLNASTLSFSTLTTNQGTIKLTQSGATSVCNVMSIPLPDGIASGTLDMGNQKMVIDYPIAPAVSPLPFVRTYLQNGYANGTWNGPGLTSSAAKDSQSQTNKGALAYFEASQNGTTSFGGVTTDTSAICLMYSSQGDATLDGKTDTMDFNVLAHNFGGTGKTSIQGEFTYDDSGSVDSADFNVLVGGFGSKIVLSAPTLGAVVPEPASLSLLAAGGLFLRRRR